MITLSWRGRDTKSSNRSSGMTETAACTAVNTSLNFVETAAELIGKFGDSACWSSRSTFPAPGTTGLQLASISTLEVLVHGWDMASGAGVPYQPDDAVVRAVQTYAMSAISEAPRGGPFGPVVSVAADADPFTALLGYLGRRG